MQPLPTTLRPPVLAALLLPLLAACGPGAAPAPSPAPAAPAPATATMGVDAANAAAATITPANVSREVHALAHDSARGRDTPSPELEKAAVYLAHRFAELGLEPAGDDGTYIHRWDYNVVTMDRQATVVQVPGQQRPVPTYEADYFLFPGLTPTVESRMFFAGAAGEARTVPAEAAGTIVVFDLAVPSLTPEWQQRLSTALQAAAGSAAGILFVLHPDFPRDIVTQLAQFTATQQAPLPVVGMAEEAAIELIAAAGGELAAARASAPGPLGDAAVEIRVARTREVHQPPNVVAIRRGADPALRDTYVLITAHFDHVGVGQPDERGDSIFNGADDNASGTAALLEIASAFMALPAAPARSVVFLAVSGEEKGLLGSMAFAESPTVPLDDIVANINLDMVGRSSPDTVIAIGQEYSTLEDVVRRIADRPGLGLTIIEDPAPEELFFFRSDQLSFIQRGIPAVFFTTGDHPDYHKPSDLPERINADKLARVARLGFHLAFEIAMDPEAPEWTEEGWREVQEKLPGGF